MIIQLILSERAVKMNLGASPLSSAPAGPQAAWIPDVRPSRSEDEGFSLCHQDLPASCACRRTHDLPRRTRRESGGAATSLILCEICAGVISFVARPLDPTCKLGNRGVASCAR